MEGQSTLGIGEMMPPAMRDAGAEQPSITCFSMRTRPSTDEEIDEKAGKAVIQIRMHQDLLVLRCEKRDRCHRGTDRCNVIIPVRHRR